MGVYPKPMGDNTSFKQAFPKYRMTESEPPSLVTLKQRELIQKLSSGASEFTDPRLVLQVCNFGICMGLLLRCSKIEPRTFRLELLKICK